MLKNFDSLYARSLDAPSKFWADAAEDVHWYERWKSVLDDSRAPFYRWFSGGRLNSCDNALDVHIEQGLGERIGKIKVCLRSLRAVEGQNSNLRGFVRALVKAEPRPTLS